MHYLIFIAALLIFVSSGPGPMLETAAAKSVACDFFTYSNAEKLLGHGTTGTDNEEKKPDGGQRWGCTYTAEGGRAKLYFSLISDVNEATATAGFEKVRASNKEHKGFEDWPGVGDEAAVHTDGTNFQLVMVRKGPRTMLVKLNPVGGTSFEDVKKISASLAEKLK